MNKKVKSPKDTARKLDAEALSAVNGGGGGGGTANAAPTEPEEEGAGG